MRNLIYYILLLALNLRLNAQVDNLLQSDNRSSLSIQNCYLRPNLIITSRASFIADLNLVLELRNNYGLAVSYSNGFTYFKDKPTDYYTGFCFIGCGETDIQSVSFTIRKYKLSKSRYFKFALEAGFSANFLMLPEFTKAEQPCFLCSNYDINYLNKFKIGILLKANTQLLIGRYFGIQLGLTSNLIYGNSYLGIDFGYLIGKLKSKMNN